MLKGRHSTRVGFVTMRPLAILTIAALAITVVVLGRAVIR